MSTTSGVGVGGVPQPPPRTVKQEVAPKGGYGKINVARNVPGSIGRIGGPILIGTSAMIMWGFYRLGTFNVKRRYVFFLFGRIHGFYVFCYAFLY